MNIPQPIGAVVAFTFIRPAREVLPFESGSAAGAMNCLVLPGFIPEALKIGEPLL